MIAPDLLGAMAGAWRAGRGPFPRLASLQRERLDAIVAFARRRSRFYGDLYAPLPDPPQDLRALPPVIKPDLMERFDAWVTDPAVTREGVEAFVADRNRIGQRYLGRYVVFATSGTTGEPALLVHDGGAVSVYLALLAARRLPGLITPGLAASFLRRGGRTAAVVATGGHFASAVVDGFARGLFPRLAGRNRTLSLLDPLPDLVRALNALRPAVLGSYPTALTLLAKEQAAGRLAIRPALALTGAEWLSPAAREEISAAFGCPVRDTYAASEFMGIAFDCGRGRLHVNADWVILEPVDAEYRPVPPGEPSHTCLLTNLANRVQPILRYDLGDCLTAAPEACPCGSPLPTVQVEGRREDVLRFRTSATSTVSLLPLALATVVEETPGVRTFQLLRSAETCLRLRIEETPGADRLRVLDAAGRRLDRFLSAQGVSGVRVELAEERPRRDPSTGKLRQIVTDARP